MLIDALTGRKAGYLHDKLATVTQYPGPQIRTGEELHCHSVLSAQRAIIVVEREIHIKTKATVIPIEIRRSLENNGVIRTTASARLIRDHLKIKHNP